MKRWRIATSYPINEMRQRVAVSLKYGTSVVAEVLVRDPASSQSQLAADAMASLIVERMNAPTTGKA